ncbi:MAG: hypothetical protein AAB421_01435 [Patescibacteria group bacterium]
MVTKKASSQKKGKAVVKAKKPAPTRTARGVKKTKTLKEVATKVAIPKKKVVSKKSVARKIPKDFASAPLFVTDKGARVGLINKDGAGYPVLTQGRSVQLGAEPAIRSRGRDHDPNRGEFYFDTQGVEVVGVFRIKEGVLVVYQTGGAHDGIYAIKIGAALFHVDGLSWHERWRTEAPILDTQWSLTKGEVVAPSSVFIDDTITLFWKSPKNSRSYAFPNPFGFLYADAKKGAYLTRYEGNPIVSPDPTQSWQSVATFNPGAVLVDGKVHLFYRAVGMGGRSVIGHAVSNDGLHFTRHTDPAYAPHTRDEGVRIPKSKKNHLFRSPTPYGVDGAEDPRVTALEGDIHMLYAAFNGYEQARSAHVKASIHGLAENDLDWTEPTLLTRPPTRWGTGGKNAALLPGKVNGKYVVLHRMWPDICIDYIDTLDFAEFKHPERWLADRCRIAIRPTHWDSGKVLVGAPPIETDAGWLLIYNAVSHQHDGGGYKMGAMILDRDDPSRVLFRTKRPILEAQTWYEEAGLVPRVTYACGAVVKDGTLFVYYGAADTYTAVATAPFTEFVAAVMRDSVEQVVPTCTPVKRRV